MKGIKIDPMISLGVVLSTLAVATVLSIILPAKPDDGDGPAT